MDKKEKQSVLFAKKEYYKFKEKLRGNINKAFIKIELDYCYIVEEIWINELENLFQLYDEYNDSYDLNKAFYGAQLNDSIDLEDLIFEGINLNFPQFINSFLDVINCIKNNKIFKLISKSFINSLYKKNNLDILKPNIFEYYGGNNKIIIKINNIINYIDKNDKALLIINPYDKDKIINNTFIILINDKIFYRKILSEKNNSIIEKKYKNNIISFINYLNNSNNIIVNNIFLNNNKNDNKTTNQYINNNINDLINEKKQKITNEKTNKSKDIYNISNYNKVSNILKYKNINRNTNKQILINKEKTLDNKELNESDLEIAYNTQPNFYKLKQYQTKEIYQKKKVFQKRPLNLYNTQNNSKERNLHSELTTPKKTFIINYDNYIKTENKNKKDRIEEFNDRKIFNNSLLINKKNLDNQSILQEK